MEKDNKDIFATNLNNLMLMKHKTRKDLSEDLKISYFTITAWAKGTKYPRMDKVELLANYFGVTKSELIEETQPKTNSPAELKLTEGEKMLLDLFRQIPENKQTLALEMVRLALKSQE